MKPRSKKVKAQAKCASFDIEVSAEFIPHGLATSEVADIQRKLKQKIADSIASLPFAHIYSCEVNVR